MLHKHPEFRVEGLSDLNTFCMVYPEANGQTWTQRLFTALLEERPDVDPDAVETQMQLNHYELLEKVYADTQEAYDSIKEYLVSHALENYFTRPTEQDLAHDFNLYTVDYHDTELLAVSYAALLLVVRDKDRVFFTFVPRVTRAMVAEYVAKNERKATPHMRSTLVRRRFQESLEDYYMLANMVMFSIERERDTPTSYRTGDNSIAADHSDDYVPFK